jgi:hypothetical protein
MSFWGTLTGSDQADGIAQAGGRAQRQSNQGYQSAQNQNAQGRTAINQGYQRGRQSLTQGRNSAISAYRGGERDALGYGQQGIEAVQGSRDTVRQGVRDANAQMQPYADQGGRAFGQYGDALGVNGSDAQQSYVNNFQGDPFREFNEQRAGKELMSRYNAAGMADSGASRLAAARANMERGTQDYQTRLDRLNGMGQQGMQASGQIGANTMNGAAQEAAINGQLANLYGQQGNIAMNAANNIGGAYQSTAGQLNQNSMSQGNALYNAYNQSGDLYRQRGLTNAGNTISMQNAANDARTQGMNNILTTAGNVASMAMGMPPTGSYGGGESSGGGGGQGNFLNSLFSGQQGSPSHFDGSYGPQIIAGRY